jgi:hypothetical protein
MLNVANLARLCSTTELDKYNGSKKPDYIYHTPEGDFRGRNPAAEANGLTPHTVFKRCKEGYEGYSLESV